VIRRLVAGGLTTALGVFINVATDNTDNIVAWLVVVALTIAVAWFTDRPAPWQWATVRGKKNAVSQRGVSQQRVSIDGDENEVVQEG
jgi:hypothetical protein